jgi:hypothetical protein
LLVSVILYNRNNELSVALIKSRNGVVHVIGLVDGGLPSLYQA